MLVAVMLVVVSSAHADTYSVQMPGFLSPLTIDPTQVVLIPQPTMADVPDWLLRKPAKKSRMYRR